MAINNLYVLGSVAVGEGSIHGVTNFDIDPGIASVMARGDGRFDPSFIAAIHQSPVLGCSTTAIADALSSIGLVGAAIETGSLSRWYFQKLQQGGIRQATGKAVLVQQGMIVPRTITAAQGALASMDVQAWALSPDAATAPLAIEDGVAVPTPPTTARRYTVGPVILPSGRIAGVTRTTIDPGLDVVVRGDEGEAYDTFCAVRTRTAGVSVRATDLDQLPASSGQENPWIGVGPITVYLRALQRAQMPFADGESEHIAVTMPDCMISIRSVGGDEDEEQEMEMSIEPVTPEDGESMFQLAIGTSIPS